jgi:hypothetical protein
VAWSFRVFQLKICMHFSSLTSVMHANYTAPQCAIFPSFYHFPTHDEITRNIIVKFRIKGQYFSVFSLGYFNIQKSFISRNINNKILGIYYCIKTWYKLWPAGHTRPKIKSGLRNYLLICHCLLQAHSFCLFRKIRKKQSWFFSSLLLYVQVSHKILT